MSQTIEMVVDSTPAIRNLDKITNSLKATANQYNQTQAIVEKANRKVAESSAAFQKATSAGLRYDASAKRWRNSTGQFATAAEKAAAGVNDLNKQLQVSNRLMSSSGKATADAVSRMRSLVLQVGAAYSAYKLLGKAVDAVNIGIQANQSWESQKLGIASVIGATNQLADAQGRVLQGSEKFAASQQVAEKLMERIQVLGLETVATTQDLVEGVQGIIAPATRVGIALEKVPDLAVNAAQAMGAMQIPLQQMRTEVEALLSGNINKAQDILATNLVITGEMVRNWQKQGTLLDEINKRLESFKLSGKELADTWSGLTSNLKEYVEFISRGATAGLFNSMKESVRELHTLMISINEQTRRAEISSKIDNITAAYKRLNDYIGEKILAATRQFSSLIEDLNRPENLSNIEKAFENLGKIIDDVSSVVSLAAKTTGFLFSSVVQGWNTLPVPIQEAGIIGAFYFGKRGWAAIALLSFLSDSIEKVNKNFGTYIPTLNHLGEDFQDLTFIANNFKSVFSGDVNLQTKVWVNELGEFRGKYNQTIEDINKGEQKVRTSSLLGQGAGKSKSELNKLESALRSVDSSLAKIQMTDAQFRQFQIDQKISEFEKTLGKTNPKVQELRVALNDKLQNDFLEEIIGYADPAEKQVIDLQKAYQKFNDTLKASTKFSVEEKLELQAKAAEQYAHSLEQVDTVQKRILDFQKETSRIEAENSNDQLSLWQTRVEQYEKELWYVKDVAERRNLIEGRVNAELAAQNKQYTADFAAMWEETYNRVDEAGADMLENFLNGSKNTFDSLKKMFIRTLAEMANAAWLRPITVQIMGTLGGVFGVGGTALAYDSATGKMVNTSGGIGNLSGLSNLMPGSWFSGIGNTINDTMAGWFPSLFSSSSGYMEAAGTELLKAGITGTAPSAAPAPGTFLSTVSPYLMAGGLGSLGYSMIGGALGLPQSKYSGLTAGLGGAAGWGLGSLAAGSFASIGATMGSVVPVVGTIIGALAGGALGSLFGQERKTHPSVYGHMMDQGYTTDTQAYIDAFMEQATYDRAGKTEASAYAQVIGEAASQTAGNILNLAAMLPEEYKKSVEDKLESATWSAGRGFSGASWNIQNWKEGMAEKDLQEAVDDMFEQMGYGANKAFAEAGIGDLFTTFDLSTEEGFKKAQTAISAISSITTAIDEIKAPTSEAEQQAKAFVAQMDALGEAVKASGLNAAYADEMIGEYRTAYVDKYVETLEEMFNPLSQIEQQAKGYKEAIDGYVSALTTMGASEAQLAQVRGYRQDAIDNITGSLDAAFFPLSEVETQTKATMESLLAYKSALETLGASAEELTRIDAAWGKMQADLLDKARAYVSTTPEIVTQTNAMNAEFDALREAMLLAGNATADLTELEETRAQAVAAMQAEYARSFEQGLAQRYATLNGTSDAVSRAISQENELREAIQKFGEGSAQVAELLHVQAAENVYAAQANVDALQNQLNQLKAQAIQVEISAINEQLSAAKTLKDTWEKLADSLYDSRVKLWTSSSDALGMFAQRDAAQAEFDRLYSLTMSGDKEAAAKLASSGDTLLSLLKETSVNGEEYTAGFWNVEQKLKDAESVAGKQLSEAQKSYNALESQLKTQQSMLDALGLNNNSLDAINAQIVTVGQQLAEALGNLNIAQSNPNYGGTTNSGYVSWEDKILAEKTASLNRGEFLQPGAPTSWTEEQTMEAIIREYGSIRNWYDLIGHPIEGFAFGGITPRNRPFLVGEKGPELMMSPQQYGVLNNQATRQLMMMPAVGTDGGATAIIAQLRENNAELKEQNRILHAMLLENQGTRKNTANTADSVENMVRTGVRTRQQ